jgi:hypothetical protein
MMLREGRLKMLNYEDVKVSYPTSYGFDITGVSLRKLVGGKRIADIICSMGDEYSDSAVTIDAIVLEDGSILTLQGEHDIVYLHDYNHLLPDEEVFENIFHTNPDNE